MQGNSHFNFLSFVPAYTLVSKWQNRLPTRNRVSEVSKSSYNFVVPIGFDFDVECLYVGGMKLLKCTKFRNILKNNKVAIVVDDLRSIDPLDPRIKRVYGTTDIVTHQGDYMENTDRPNSQYIRVNPKKKWSWEK